MDQYDPDTGRLLPPQVGDVTKSILSGQPMVFTGKGWIPAGSASPPPKPMQAKPTPPAAPRPQATARPQASSSSTIPLPRSDPRPPFQMGSPGDIDQGEPPMGAAPEPSMLNANLFFGPDYYKGAAGQQERNIETATGGDINNPAKPKRTRMPILPEQPLTGDLTSDTATKDAEGNFTSKEQLQRPQDSDITQSFTHPTLTNNPATSFFKMLTNPGNIPPPTSPQSAPPTENVPLPRPRPAVQKFQDQMPKGPQGAFRDMDADPNMRQQATSSIPEGSVATNDQGDYRLFTGGSWTPVENGAYFKNPDTGEYRQFRDGKFYPSATGPGWMEGMINKASNWLSKGGNPGVVDPFSGQVYDQPGTPEKPSIQAGEAGANREFMEGMPVTGAAIARNVPETEEQRSAREQFEKDNPGKAATIRGLGAAAELTPAMMAAPALFGSGESLPMIAKPFVSAVTGGALGGADELIRGEDPLSSVGTVHVPYLDEDISVPRIAVDTGLGFAAPIAGGIVGETLGGAANVLQKLFGVGTPAALKGVPPETLNAFYAALKGQGQTDAQIAQKAMELGPEGLIADYSPQTRGLTRAAAAESPIANEKIQNTLQARAANAPSAMEKIINDTTQPRINVDQRIRELSGTQSENAEKDYGEFYKQKVKVFPELTQLYPYLKNSGVIDELVKLQQITPGAEQSKRFFTGQMIPGYQPPHDLATGQMAGRIYPTAEGWDQVHRLLAEKADSFSPWSDFGLKNPDESAVKYAAYSNLSDQLDSAIKKSNPQAFMLWKQARGNFGDIAKIKSALSAGQNWRNYTQDQFQYMWGKMNQIEKKSFEYGMRNDLDDMLDGTRKGVQKFSDFVAIPKNQQKLELMYGPEKTHEIISEGARREAFAQTQKSVKDFAEQQATQAATGALHPQTATQQMIDRITYAPTITPSTYMPFYGTVKAKAAEEAARIAAKGAEGGANVLTKPLQGNEAMIRALYGYQPPNVRVGPVASRATNLMVRNLGQGMPQ